MVKTLREVWSEGGRQLPFRAKADKDFCIPKEEWIDHPNLIMEVTSLDIDPKRFYTKTNYWDGAHHAAWELVGSQTLRQQIGKWYTLLEVFEQAGKRFPFTVEWHIK